MKLVVFAHTPPPHHGQSYMVQLVLEGLGGDVHAARNPGSTAPGALPTNASLVTDIQCYHVNCRLSEGLSDIGQARGGKLAPLLRYCLQAIWLRLRYGADRMYFVPATGCRLGLLRDWIVMALCRPFFRRIIYHWEAAGLGVWLQDEARPWERWISRCLVFRPHLSIVLGDYGRRDGEAMHSRRVEVVPNGIPDPAPDFEREILPLRQRRTAERMAALAEAGPTSQSPASLRIVRLLYLSLCCREKGLFDVVEGLALANRQWAERGCPLRAQLRVAGTFWHATEEEEFRQRLLQRDMTLTVGERGNVARAGAGEPVAAVEYVGFATGKDKRRLFLESDCFCFPTYYSAESFPLALLEAMAYGLPLVTTRWRNIPELLPRDYPGLVEPRSPMQIAAAIRAHAEAPYDRALRDRFLAGYTREIFISKMAAALRSVE